MSSFKFELNTCDTPQVALPLVTAIATGNPSGADPGSTLEALDSAALDRFTLHARSEGLLASGDWDSAMRVLPSPADHAILIQVEAGETTDLISWGVTLSELLEVAGCCRMLLKAAG